MRLMQRFNLKVSHRLAVVTLVLLASCQFARAANPQVAIVIDDIGYRLSDQAAVDLTGQFTYAVVPFAPLTQRLAHAVYTSEREVIAHLPMEALSNNHLLGKGALISSMDEAEIRAQINLSIDNIPHVRGINNHMGSKFTTQPKPLNWLMDELSQRNLYFLDSKTTPLSMAERSASMHGIRTAHRHIFLDNKLDEAYLSGQFKQLIALAKANNHAIAIAHPHPQTVAFLHTIAPLLKQHNIDLVPLSMLLPTTTAQAKKRHENTQLVSVNSGQGVAPN